MASRREFNQRQATDILVPLPEFCPRLIRVSSREH
jgi:hypothetical protein